MAGKKFYKEETKKKILQREFSRSHYNYSYNKSAKMPKIAFLVFQKLNTKHSLEKPDYGSLSQLNGVGKYCCNM